MKAFTIGAGLALAFALPAMAQSTPGNNPGSPGTTSGPAAGTNVEPGTVTQKQAQQKPSNAAGAPGAEAKPGSESGQPPKGPPQH